MPAFKCVDIGMKDDPFEVKTKTEDELMKIVAAHAEYVHGIKAMPADLKKQVEKAVKP